MNIFYQRVGSLTVAGWAVTALAASVIKAFKAPFVPTPFTSKADLVANECDYDGYASITIAAWNDPGFAAAGGSSIDSGYFQFEYLDGMTHVSNNVGGFWIETATGDVIVVGVYDTPVPMEQNGNIAPVEVVLNFGS